MPKRPTLVFVGLITCWLPVVAQTVDARAPFAAAESNSQPTVGAVTLEQAISKALNANPKLAATRFEVQAADAALVQAGARPNPTLDVEVLDRRRETRESTMQISQPIELGGKRQARLLAADRDRAGARIESITQISDLRASVAKAFTDALEAQARAVLAEDTLANATQVVDVTSKRVAAGKISPVDETRAKVAQSGAELELVHARNAFALARKTLAGLWGATRPDFDHVDGRLDALPALPDFAQLRKRLDESPSLLRARNEIGKREAITQIEQSRRVGDISLKLGMKRNEEMARNQAIVGISVPLPLFDRNAGAVLESLRRTDGARAALTGAQVAADVELGQAYENLKMALQTIDMLKAKVLPGAQSAYEAATKGFEYGKFSFLDVLDAQRTLLQLKSQYLSTLAEAHRAAAELERIAGGPVQSSQNQEQFK